jgi:hypothetical protein
MKKLEETKQKLKGKSIRVEKVGKVLRPKVA